MSCKFQLEIIFLVLVVLFHTSCHFPNQNQAQVLLRYLCVNDGFEASTDLSEEKKNQMMS